MKYQITFKPRAVKDIKAISVKVRDRILDRIEIMGDDLSGDVKRLTNSTPEFRLRVGDYRVLFEIEEDTIVIYRIRHRREVYR
jgi:mRNA interferase RelE/StbE